MKYKEEDPTWFGPVSLKQMSYMIQEGKYVVPENDDDEDDGNDGDKKEQTADEKPVHLDSLPAGSAWGRAQ